MDNCLTLPACNTCGENDESLASKKEFLREQAISCRDNIRISPEEMESLARLVIEETNPSEGDIIAAFWPKGREIDIRYSFDDITASGAGIALPVVEKGSIILKFALWDEKTELEKASFGIMEPVVKNYVTPDVLILPLLAFDRKGHRLGYGGGYYDATIAYLRKDKPSLRTIGVAYAQQAVLFNLPAEEHDQRLDIVITPNKIHYF